ncbi:hypothetical protein KAR28_00155 [Candidatus Parcubacteria bacterium]|nr:hypothetical protein [Candidatus Parcubacteria bacterium]
MIKYNKKILKLVCFIFLFFTISIFAANFVTAGLIDESVLDEIDQHEARFVAFSGFSEGISLGQLANMVIKAFLGLLAIIFIILIIIGGYGWMMAGGDESKVTKAIETIRQAIIGLVIVVSAYAITYFVFNALPWGG